MKKNHLLASAALLAVVNASHAQLDLIAGWDFGQFVFSGWSSTDQTFTNNGTSIPANYSESRNVSPVGTHEGGSPVSAGTGTIFWDGQFSSSVFDGSFAGSSEIQAAPGTTVTNATMIGTNVIGASTFARTLSNFDSDPNSLALQVQLSSSKDLSFRLDLTGYTDFVPAEQGGVQNFTFAASSQNASTITWLINGSQFGQTTTLSAGELSAFTAYSVDLPETFYGSEGTLTARFSSGSLIILDNIQANGLVSAVPEPSSFAAIAGLLGLGFSVARRRARAV